MMKTGQTTYLIDIKPIGNLGNRMIQYAAASKIRDALGNSIICDSSCPEWFEHETTGRPVPKPQNPYVIAPDNLVSFDAIIGSILGNNFDGVLVADHMQRLDCLPSAERTRALFPFAGPHHQTAGSELLINVRAAEIVSGIRHYPLVPLQYFEDIISKSGLSPVFMGQIGSNKYCDALRDRFFKARFLPSVSPLHDFRTILQAQNIIISVSTFSWLAAWLSRARHIYVPMLGFYNPMHFGGRKIIDLLDPDDERFQFSQFPLAFGVPETQALIHHEELIKGAVAISRRQVRFLKTETPILPSIYSPPELQFDEVWYTHTHLEAAKEISQGWFASPLDHYLEIGRRRGYLPLPESITINSGTETHISQGQSVLSSHKRARQSSVSDWSIGNTPEEDAARAVELLPCAPFAFHTAFEENPWWEVDLETACDITAVMIYNRCENEVIRGRATPLMILSALVDGEWSFRYQTPPSYIPGEHGSSFLWTAPQSFAARWVRLSVPRMTFLHLRQVSVIGRTI